MKSSLHSGSAAAAAAAAAATPPLWLWSDVASSYSFSRAVSSGPYPPSSPPLAAAPAVRAALATSASAAAAGGVASSPASALLANMSRRPLVIASSTPGFFSGGGEARAAVLLASARTSISMATSPALPLARRVSDTTEGCVVLFQSSDPFLAASMFCLVRKGSSCNSAMVAPTRSRCSWTPAAFLSSTTIFSPAWHWPLPASPAAPTPSHLDPPRSSSMSNARTIDATAVSPAGAVLSSVTTQRCVFSGPNATSSKARSAVEAPPSWGS
mmetsp:Transcript_281/g.742  ORF Transcript_281/g.742 Transcript_281/m.742 type:complete len:270 (+) Transcript_281:1122-1931(+)